jgi:hypothetical protein
MSKYWFKPKRFGWGFFPITWQGWLSTLVLLSTLLLSVYVNKINSEPSQSGVSKFILDTVIIISVFSCLFKDKVKGGLRWQWGSDNSTSRA